MSPTIAIVHATPASITPATDALAERFADAQPWHLLDDRLATEADAARGELTPALRRRMLSLIEHAIDGGADAVLLACSMYGPVTRLASQLWEQPIMGSDQAMHELLVADAHNRVGLLASLDSSLADAAGRLQTSLSDARVNTELRGTVITNGSLLEAAELLAATVDALVICQYSLAPAAAELEAALAVPVYSPPHLAADALKAAIA